MSRLDEREDPDCVCSVGMKFTWDINDPKLPQDTKQFDPFQEWTDGYVRFIYSAEDKNAQRHLSGWAMRNTNNHNCQILKKSCLGVVVCARGCSLTEGGGLRVQLRPAICDKARQKQQKKLCPSCSSPLELLPCRGHSGYPVTNFWRVDGKSIFFQAKGVHDHPRPESKSETEARRSSVKRRVSSPPFTPKRRMMDTQGLGPALLSCVDPSDRISFMEPSYPQHYPTFQSPESYYNPHNALGEAPPSLQKPTNQRLYMGRPGYDFQGYLTSPSYPMTSELCDPRVTPVLGPSPSPSTFDPKLKSSAPYPDNHHYYGDYPCRYPGNAPGSPAALQTIITTTTKVSYQPCPKPPVSLPSYQSKPGSSYSPCPPAKGPGQSYPPCAPPKPPTGLPSCSSLLEESNPNTHTHRDQINPNTHTHRDTINPNTHTHRDLSNPNTHTHRDPGNSYSTEVKVTEESGGVIKSLSFPPDAMATKTERADGYDYRYPAYPNTYRYDDY